MSGQRRYQHRRIGALSSLCLSYFFLSFLFVRYIGSEDPREQWLTDSRVQDSRLLLESLLLDVDDNGRPRSIQFYAVVDRSGTVSESIRSMISQRDQISFLQALQSMIDVEFSTFLDKIESNEISNQFVRFRELSETNMNSNTLATIESYLIHGTPVEQSEHSLFVEFFSEWWKDNPTIVAETSPLVSTNFFLEVHNASASEKDIQSLLYQDKIVGYFILPEAQSTRTGKFIFVASTLTPRVRVLDLVNWYRSVATSAVQDRSHTTRLFTECMYTTETCVECGSDLARWRPLYTMVSNVPEYEAWSVALSPCTLVA